MRAPLMRMASRSCETPVAIAEVKAVGGGVLGLVLLLVWVVVREGEGEKI